MANHTPGPWNLDMDNEEEPCISVPAFHNGITFGCYEICNRVGGQIHSGPEFDDYSEVHANARLIASAPDLLKALEDAHAKLRSILAAYPKEIGPLHCGTLLCADRAHAALAKAGL